MNAKIAPFETRDPHAEKAADACAEADVAAGRVISHAAVKTLVSSWGSDTRLPRPDIGD